MRNIVSLHEINPTDISLVGGKAVNLAWAKRHGFQSPKGFVVTSGAWEEFLERDSRSDKIQSLLNDKSLFAKSDDFFRRTNEIISQGKFSDSFITTLQAQLECFEPDQLFAVRSSAAFEDGSSRSWAGQFDSYLNVPAERVAETIKRVWSSIFNGRAISYEPNQFREIPKHFGVIVQGMVKSEKAGVAFSRKPNVDLADRMLIEAVVGQGDSLVSGRALSVSLTLDRTTGEVTSGQDDGSILNKDEIDAINRAVGQIEEKFGAPVDVEWALTGNELFILQVRPITGLKQNDGSLFAFPDLSEHELTFKVVGLSFLFTDMLSDAFEYLDPVFISDAQANFYQYFTNQKMRFARDYGLRWFGTPGSVEKYESAFRDFYAETKTTLDGVVSQSRLSVEGLECAFGLLSRSLEKYSKTDTQFTDSAYKSSATNPIISENLARLAKFKDVARTWINELMIEEHSYFSRVVDIVAKQTSVSATDLNYYKISELKQLISIDTKVSTKVLRERESAYMFISKQGADRMYAYGTAVVDYAKKHVGHVPADATTVTGKVAHRTHSAIEGLSYVITVNYADMDAMAAQVESMPEGRILVADFTAPELLSACRKAKAIVTDIGGLLSHAAIVSRELNIPCIVGTQNASRIFKTGDSLVANFESGAVRIN